MGKKVSIDGLEDAINDILKDYENDVKKAAAPVIKKAAETAKAELRATSPEDTGEYKKGWRYKKSSDGMSYTIYNDAKPGLTHLLENGHASRNGGRVAAKPHIKPVEEKVKEALPDELKNAIEKI